MHLFAYMDICMYICIFNNNSLTKQMIMETTQKPLVIENPSQKLLEFARSLERRKAEVRKDLMSKKDKYFPAKEGN